MGPIGTTFFGGFFISFFWSWKRPFSDGGCSGFRPRSGHVYTLFFVMIGWLIFAMENLSSGFSYWKTMFGGGSGFLGGGDLYALLRNAILAAICILACTPLPKRIFRRFYEKSRITAYAAAVGGLLLLLLCTAYLVDSSFNPFLYWNF